MRFLIPLVIYLWAASFGSAGVADNVNSRYTIESVDFEGELDRNKFSDKLRDDLQKLVGEKYDQSSVDGLMRRLQGEFRRRKITHRIGRGDKQDYVKLVFEGSRRRIDEDATVSKLAYHSKQGWTGGLEIDADLKGSRLAFGIQSDGDELLERYAGINASYSQGIGDRAKLRFQFESFHQQWNRATLLALDQAPHVPGIYRTRWNYEPSVSVAVAGPLIWTAGVSFQNFQTQFPVARTEAANAVINTLRYQRQWTASTSSKQVLDAGYSLRAATNLLDSDFVYARNTVDARYSYEVTRHTALVRFQAGRISGRAPLFERYSLGNTQTLRGWNKFDLNPLGGTRVVSGAAEYRYQVLQVFYDSGSVWDGGEDPTARHSMGFGFAEESFALSVAFPLRSGRIEPIFLLSMNF